MKKALSIPVMILTVLVLAAFASGVRADDDGGMPVPEEGAFDAAYAEANDKLGQVKSLHIDMTLDLQLEEHMTGGGTGQSGSVAAGMAYHVDVTVDPAVVRAEMLFSVTKDGEKSSEGALSYAARDGETAVTYRSGDGGMTWERQTDPEGDFLPESFSGIIDPFVDRTVRFRRNGTADVNGRPAAVYTGTADSTCLYRGMIHDFLAALVDSAGAAEAFSGSPEEAFSGLSGIEVTFMADEESGLPVRYTADMTAAVRDLLRGRGDAGTAPDVSMAALDIVLSGFDAVGPITVPEAALNVPADEAPTDYLAATLERMQDNEDRPCVSISLTTRPGDTLTIMLPNQDDYTVVNEDDDDQPYILVIPEVCYYPNVPLSSPVYTVTPLILVTHADGTQDFLQVDPFEIVFPAVELELFEPAGPDEIVAAAAGCRFRITGKAEDHTVSVTVNGQSVTDIYEEGYFEYIYTVTGAASETVTVDASRENRVSSSVVFTVMPLS